MANGPANHVTLAPKSDGHFFLTSKCQPYSQSGLVFASGNAPTNLTTLPISSSCLTPAQGVQLGTLPIKVKQNTPVFASTPTPHHQAIGNAPRVSAQKGPANSNIGQASQQAGFSPNYANLTSWTTKLTSPESLPFPSPSCEVVDVPMMSGQPSNIPRTPVSSHLSSRMYKASPYHNAFSHMSPLQPSPAGKLKTVNGNSPDAAMAAVLPMNSSGEVVLKSIPSRENRFKKTAEALQKSGLWEVAMKTGNLIKRNQELQKELEQFKMDALNFLKSVIKNPENRDFIKSVLNSALSARSSDNKKSSVMTVVVSAAASAIKYKPATATSFGTGSKMADAVSRNNCVTEKPGFDHVISSDVNRSLPNMDLIHATSTSVV